MTGSAETSHVCTKTEIRFIPQLIEMRQKLVIAMHAHCLHWLMSTGLLFQSAFCQSCINLQVNWSQWRALNQQWRGPDIAATVNIAMYVSLGLVVDYWAIV